MKKINNAHLRALFERRHPWMRLSALCLYCKPFLFWKIIRKFHTNNHFWMLRFISLECRSVSKFDFSFVFGTKCGGCLCVRVRVACRLLNCFQLNFIYCFLRVSSSSSSSSFFAFFCLLPLSFFIYFTCHSVNHKTTGKWKTVMCRLA